MGHEIQGLCNPTILLNRLSFLHRSNGSHFPDERPYAPKNLLNLHALAGRKKSFGVAGALSRQMNGRKVRNERLLRSLTLYQDIWSCALNGADSSE
jgi:hypothetical protein